MRRYAVLLEHKRISAMLPIAGSNHFNNSSLQQWLPLIFTPGFTNTRPEQTSFETATGTVSHFTDLLKVGQICKSRLAAMSCFLVVAGTYMQSLSQGGGLVCSCVVFIIVFNHFYWFYCAIQLVVLQRYTSVICRHDTSTGLMVQSRITLIFVTF